MVHLILLRSGEIMRGGILFNDAHQRKAVSNRRRNTDVDAFGWAVVVLIAALIILLGLESAQTHATAADADQPAGYESVFGFGKQSLGISAGHGLALPIGGTQTPQLEDIQFVYVAPRWGVGITDPLGGHSWYRGNFELSIEATFLYMFEPKRGVAGGVAPMVRYNFLTGSRFIPFLQAGAGVIALDADLRQQADGVNFILQSGVGLHYFISQHTALTGEWRFHHISNANIHDRNAGINSSLVMLGVTFFFR
jgi:lipid A 3-O-deacylase